MSENPYRLARDVRGIGFKAADAITMKLGIREDADGWPNRTSRALHGRRLRQCVPERSKAGYDRKSESARECGST